MAMDLQGSFWTSGLADSVSQSTSTITAILSDESQCNLSLLLADSDILQECKSSNAGLLTYLSKSEIIEELVGLIGSGSSDPKSQDERMAYIASEIVACEMPQITEAIVSSDAAMLKLFSQFSSSTDRVDDRRAGHFRKAAAILIQKNYKEVADFLNRNQELVLTMINQIDNTSVLEVLIMLGWDDGNIENTNDRKWLFDLKFIPAIVKIFDSDHYELQHINASQGLIDMVLKCPIESTSILVNHLCSPTVLSNFIENILSGSPSSFENGLGVLSVIAQRQTMLNQDLEDQIFSEEVPFPIAMILEKLPAIISFGKNSPFPDPMPSSMGGMLKPLGAIKLKLAELILSILRTGVASVQTKVVETQFVPLLVSYFFEFKWNTILHFITESIALTILSPKTQENLIQEFLQGSRFVSQAMALYDENQKLIAQRKAQFGNIGHTLRILNLVVELSLQLPNIKEWIHEDSASWRTFISEKLTTENQKFSIQLGGFKPELEESKSNGQNFAHNLPADDDFMVSAETNFEHDVNNAQTEAIFDMMNNPTTAFDNEPWPGLSFDDQEFHLVEGDGMFEHLEEFSSSNSEIVNPMQEPNQRSNS